LTGPDRGDRILIGVKALSAVEQHQARPDTAEPRGDRCPYRARQCGEGVGRAQRGGQIPVVVEQFGDQPQPYQPGEHLR